MPKTSVAARCAKFAADHADKDFSAVIELIRLSG
jgi:hypothetical protein